MENLTTQIDWTAAGRAAASGNPLPFYASPRDCRRRQHFDPQHFATAGQALDYVSRVGQDDWAIYAPSGAVVALPEWEFEVPELGD